MSDEDVKEVIAQNLTSNCSNDIFEHEFLIEQLLSLCGKNRSCVRNNLQRMKDVCKLIQEYDIFDFRRQVDMIAKRYNQSSKSVCASLSSSWNIRLSKVHLLYNASKKARGILKKLMTRPPNPLISDTLGTITGIQLNIPLKNMKKFICILRNYRNVDQPNLYKIKVCNAYLPQIGTVWYILHNDKHGLQLGEEIHNEELKHQLKIEKHEFTNDEIKHMNLNLNNNSFVHLNVNGESVYWVPYTQTIPGEIEQEFHILNTDDMENTLRKIVENRFTINHIKSEIDLDSLTRYDIRTPTED
jgi:hypothetical protein